MQTNPPAVEQNKNIKWSDSPCNQSGLELVIRLVLDLGLELFYGIFHEQ